MRGSLGEKIGEGDSADIHAWAPGQVVKLFKSGRERRLSRHEAQMTRAAFRRRPPGAGGVRRGNPGWALRHRAVAPRGTDPAAAPADPRHDARAGRRDPRGPLHIGAQNATAAGHNLPVRLDTRPSLMGPVMSSLSRCNRLPVQLVSTIIVDLLPSIRGLDLPGVLDGLLASLRGQPFDCQHDAIRGELVSTI